MVDKNEMEVVSDDYQTIYFEMVSNAPVNSDSPLEWGNKP